MLVLTGAVAEAQQTGKIFRIGFLDPSTASGSAVLLDAFRQELSKLGWIEEKNFTIEYRVGENKGAEPLPDLAAELVRLKVDLILVADTPSSLAAKRATTTIPIVMVSVGDPVAARLVANLARPGGNVTGFSALSVGAKYQKARDTQGRDPQARRSWTSAAGGWIRPPTQKPQGCGGGIEAKFGGDRESTGRQRFRERLSNCKAKAGRRDLDAQQPSLFAERRRIVQLAAKHGFQLFTTRRVRR